MSIHYLIDPFTTNGDIIDVVTAESGVTNSTGSSIVRVPDGVAIAGNPSDITTLLIDKYAGLLAFYAGFTDIIGDSCTDALTVNTPSTIGLLAGTASVPGPPNAGFVNHCLLPLGGILISVAFPLGYAPSQCVIAWEEYSFADSDDKTGRLQRSYTEESGSNLLCLASFNNGATSNVTTNGSVLNIPAPDQGTSFIITLANPGVSRMHLGSWALVYQP